MFKALINCFLQIIFFGILITTAEAMEISTNNRLNEEMSNLIAVDAAWKTNETDFRQMRKIDKSSDLEIEDFAKYVANLKLQVFVGCEAVRVLGGNAKKNGVDCVEIKNDPQINKKEDLSSVTREPTREEEMNKLAEDLTKLESEFDGMIMDQQALLKKESRPSQSDSSGNGNSARAENESQEKKSGSKTSQTEVGAGSTVEKEDSSPALQSENAGDPRDDDIIARQLREAAESETDPVLKEQLWEEYRNYKKSNR